jgi:hypothetical protein
MREQKIWLVLDKGKLLKGFAIHADARCFVHNTNLKVKEGIVKWEYEMPQKSLILK